MAPDLGRRRLLAGLAGAAVLGGGAAVVRSRLSGAGALAPAAVGVVADAAGFRLAFALLAGSMGLAAAVAAGLWATA